MRFSWDLSKDLLNQRDHGITFQEATTVFGDSLAVTVSDPDHSVGEGRSITIGQSSSGPSHANKSPPLRFRRIRLHRGVGARAIRLQHRLWKGLGVRFFYTRRVVVTLSSGAAGRRTGRLLARGFYICRFRGGHVRQCQHEGRALATRFCEVFSELISTEGTKCSVRSVGTHRSHTKATGAPFLRKRRPWRKRGAHHLRGRPNCVFRNRTVRTQPQGA